MKRPIAVYPTQAEIKALLHYDPESGVFTWRVALPTRRVGAPAGCEKTNGYRAIKIDGRILLEHRLAWIYMTGALPPHQIDHINGDRHDNRWANLRAANSSQNMQNQRGAKGASRHKPSGTWQSSIKINGKTIWLGKFPTFEEARAAYLAAKAIHHPYAVLS
ncbi:MAG: HNH endonuclease [Chitinophagaceae bacterium]|nr:MAG: HNH endonuclease [Chitinophagaceae bacterium]